MSALVVGKSIGSGAYGTVYTATWEGRKVAIKKFNLSQEDVRQASAIQEEIRIVKLLRDSYIVQFYGEVFHEGKLVLVMDHAKGGSLQRAIDTKRITDWQTKERIAEEVARGLRYIHSKGVLHCDLKSMNVLLTEDMDAKICDFGLATIRSRSSSESAGPAGGTLRWMAPELFDTTPKASVKSDMYALGMVMWELAAGCTTPFKDQRDNEKLVKSVREGARETLPGDTPATYRRWVERCWDKEPAKRPEASAMIPLMEEIFSSGTKNHLRSNPTK